MVYKIKNNKIFEKNINQGKPEPLNPKTENARLNKILPLKVNVKIHTAIRKYFNATKCVPEDAEMGKADLCFSTPHRWKQL